MAWRPKTPWSPEEDARLKQLCSERSLPAIVPEFAPKTREQVRHRIRQLGYHTQSPGERPFRDIEKIRKYSDQHGLQAAAKNFNLSYDIVCNIRRRYTRTVKKTYDALSPKQILALRKKAAYYAYRKGRPNDQDDFGSFCVMYRLTHEFVKIEYLWQNFADKAYGNMGSKSGRAERRAHDQYVEIQDAPDFDEPNPGMQVAGEDKRDTEDLADFGGLSNQFGLSGTDRIIFFLYYKWGQTYDEIAEVLGVTGSRIGQIHTELTLKIRNNLPVPISRQPPKPKPKPRRPPLPPLPNGEKRKRGRPPLKGRGPDRSPSG